MSTRARILSGFILVVAAMAAWSQAATAQKIGVDSAVRNDVSGIQGGAARPLSNGSDVSANERIRTGQQSTAQLLFLDQTSLSVGAQSEVVLDRFVYDPNRGNGKVVINAGVGAFRFVSGAQKSSSYEIRTPVATIGVRGTVIHWIVKQISPGVYWAVFFVRQGEITINFGGKTFTLKAGEAITYSTSTGLQGPYQMDFFNERTMQYVFNGTLDLQILINVLGGRPCGSMGCPG
jgi:hypothetical protein